MDRKCACVTSAGHMMQIERLGESRADPAENTCEIEKRTVVINYARNKHSVVQKYSEQLCFSLFCVQMGLFSLSQF